MDVNELIGLDFETYGAVSLPEHGLERYVDDMTFRPLIASTYEHLTSGAIYLHRHVLWDDRDREALMHRLSDRVVVAHNAGFEKRVNRWLDIDQYIKGYIDSAVCARAMGAAGKLEAAAPQLLNHDKLEDGYRLIRLFSIPSKEQVEDGDLDFDPNLIVKHAEDWETFNVYCDLDAELGFRLAKQAIQSGYFDLPEWEYQDVTMRMNEIGWNVDVPLVEEMQRRYLENQQAALEKFRSDFMEPDLNLSSHKQLKEWCAERGIRARSFDEKNVETLRAKISRKLDEFDAGAATPKAGQYEEYCEVLAMLETKQVLGGSSLKKLKTILDTTSKDGRLRDQYLHIGAAQTWRTTGRSVQMQNLKRLGPVVDDVEVLHDEDTEWTNDDMARNLRQVFTASDPDGFLIVGDFSSVESRGLAWLAGDRDKLDNFRKGLDVYKVGAAKQYHVAYDAVTKEQRQFGKVGELSCGYQAGGGAVQSFAAGMGVELSEAEAAQLVADWRDANPKIVQLWAALDNALKDGFTLGRGTAMVGENYYVLVSHEDTPPSLLKQHPKGAVSLRVTLVNGAGFGVFRRVFHGVYERGRSLCYYKPTERKTGDVWVNHSKDPKTKQVRFFNVYGGKLAGILTQSLCRQIFFEVLKRVDTALSFEPGLRLVGQFHDEIVLDWRSTKTGWSLEKAERMLTMEMSYTQLPNFPLTADVKHDYRYTK